MLTFTGTAYQTDWKQKMHQVLLKNELGNNPDLAYILSYAGFNSGYSFGYQQWDLANNAAAPEMLRDMLQNATNVNGQYIVDDGNPSTGRANDTLIQALMDQAVRAGGNSLTTAQRDLINQALSSNYGQNIIEQNYDRYLGEVLEYIDGVIGSVGDPQDKAFLQTDTAKLFLVDYHNQFDITINGAMYNFLNGQSTVIGGSGVQKINRLGIDDLLNFYFSTTYARTNAGLNDELRRFNNIISVAGGYALPGDQTARAEEAKGLLRVYQDYLKGKESQLANFARLDTIILESARAVLIAQYVNDVGINVSINGEVIVGEYQLSIARNTKHSTDADVLTGTIQSDLIFGEGGNDYIDGGAGNDVMLGGSGLDTYIINSGDGQDTIVDSDGSGRIIYDGKAVTLGLHKNSDPAGTWYGQNGEIFTKSGNDPLAGLRANNLLKLAA